MNREHTSHPIAARRGMGLRLKFNAALVPLVAATLAGSVALDYRHEVNAIMEAHAMHGAPIGGAAATGPIAAPITPEAVARRSMRMHAAYGVGTLLLLIVGINIATERFVFRPLDRIRDRMDQMARGHWRPGDQRGTTDELGALFDGFQALGLTIDALAGQLLTTERHAVLALVSQAVSARLTPQIERLSRVVATLHASGLSGSGAAREVAGATAEIAAAVRGLDTSVAKVLPRQIAPANGESAPDAFAPVTDFDRSDSTSRASGSPW